MLVRHQRCRSLASKDCLRSQAAKRIQDTLQWRQHECPEEVVCHACSVNPRSHYMHPVGYDLHDRPVLYSCFKLASNRIVEDNRQHMISTFEQARPGLALCANMGLHAVPRLYGKLDNDAACDVADSGAIADCTYWVCCGGQTIRMMPPRVEQWVWFSDFHGFGFQDCDTRMGKTFLVCPCLTPLQIGTSEDRPICIPSHIMLAS